MKETKDILTLLGIPSDKIKSFMVETVDHFSIIHVELEDIRTFCPKCHSTKSCIKGYYTITVNNSLIKHTEIVVRIRVRRYKCLNCGKTYKQDMNFTQREDHISIAVKRAILDDLAERLTFKQIAIDHNVSINTVRRIFDYVVLPQVALQLSEIICIDEFCYKHKTKNGKYPCVITNPMTGDIIDIIESRWKSILIDYFNKVKIPIRNKVKYFVSDMNETYRIIKRIFFKEAIHVADRFHVIKAFNEAITSIRTRIIKQEVWQEKEYRYLKKHWKIFLKDRQKLETIKIVDSDGVVQDPTIELDKCLAKYPDLYYAYWTKEEFRNKTKNLMLFKDAESIVDFNINKMLKSAIPEIVRVGKTFQNWRTEIINGITRNPYSIKISNSIAEATNNQIQTLIDLSYGIPNFERLRKRVLYINRNRKK